MDQETKEKQILEEEKKCKLEAVEKEPEEPNIKITTAVNRELPAIDKKVEEVVVENETKKKIHIELSSYVNDIHSEEIEAKKTKEIEVMVKS